MQADRWSSTAWFAALGIDIVLCIYLAVSVCWNPPTPPPGLRDAEVPLANEVRCGRPYLNRLLGAVDMIERELWSAVDEQAASESDREKRALQIRIEDLNDRLHRIHMAYVDCDEVRRVQAALSDENDRPRLDWIMAQLEAFDRRISDAVHDIGVAHDQSERDAAYARLEELRTVHADLRQQIADARAERIERRKVLSLEK
jgi:hypothetical protein